MDKFNLSLDDFSPHPKAGLNFEAIDACNKLIEKYPDLKINLFVPAAYCRLGEEPCYLSKHPEWVKRVNKLPSKNFRINFHGIFHRRHPDDAISEGPNIWKVHTGKTKSNNDEWQYLNYTDAKLMYMNMLIQFNKAGLNFSKVFRPPGWKISREACSLFVEKGIMIAGNKEYYRKYQSTIDKLDKYWISYNYDLIGPVPNGDIIAYGHTSNWTNNYLNQEKYEILLNILYQRKFEFKFLEEFKDGV